MFDIIIIGINYAYPAKLHLSKMYNKENPARQAFSFFKILLKTLNKLWDLKEAITF